MKKIILIVIFVAGTATAFGFDCNVTCPSGYVGGCVKSDSGCNCSCKPDAKGVKEDIVKALEAAGATGTIVGQAKGFLGKTTELPFEKTFKDIETGKQFTIFLKKENGVQSPLRPTNP